MKKYFIVLFAIFATSQTYAWYADGHAAQMEMVLKYLPKEISSVWTSQQKSNMCRQWANMPDMHQRIFDQEIKSAGGKDFVFIEKIADRCGFFHSKRGRCAAFFMLAKAFRQKDWAAAAMYAGNLNHHMADAGAFNHSAMLQYVTANIMEKDFYKNIKTPPLDFLDYSAIKKYPQVQNLADKMLADFTPDRTQKNLFDSLVRVYSSSPFDSQKMTAIDNLTLRFDKDFTPSKDAIFAVAYTADYQTREGVNLICAAWDIANSPEELNPENCEFLSRKKNKKTPIADAANKKINEFLASRKAADDSIFTDLFKFSNAQKDDEPSIGFIAEATYDMGDSKIGFGSKMYTSIIARTLKNEGEKIKMFELSEIEKSAPDAKKVPIMIVVMNRPNWVSRTASQDVEHNFSINFKYPQTIIDNLKKYADAGGKIVFIGGCGEGGLMGLDRSIFYLKNSEIPVSSRWDIDNIQLCNAATISMLGDFKNVAASPQKFRINPNLLGWNKPFSNVAFKTDSPEILPIAKLDYEGKSVCIAAARKDANGKIQAVYLPQYFFLFFVLSDQKTLPDWSLPTLDSFGRGVILQTLQILKQ